MSFEFALEFWSSVSSYFYWDVIQEISGYLTKSSPSMVNHVKIRDR